MSAAQIELIGWAKQQGPIFVIMAVVVWVLYSKLNQQEQRYEQKIERIETKIDDCNRAQIEIMRNQIEKSNMLMESLKGK